MIEIKHINNIVIYESKKETLGEAVKEAHSKGINLSYANLKGADLSKLNIKGVNLFLANLEGADLSHCFLNSANLYGVNFKNAHLNLASLSHSTLTLADMRGADLTRAYFYSSDLTGAKLKGALINWQSRELISEILRQEAAEDIERLKIAALIRMMNDWCWKDWIKLHNDPNYEWAMKTLESYVLNPDFFPPYKYGYK